MSQLRRTAVRVVLIAAFAGFGVPGPRAHAQAPGPQSPPSAPTIPAAPLSGVLHLRSEPSGAFVTLAGEHEWRGTTPFDVARGINGPYEISVEMSGYERWHRSVLLADGETRDLSIRLTPKSAVRAGLRSLFFPGWGQFYSERPGKGAVLLLGTAAAATGLLITHEEYQDREDDVRSAQDAYFHSTQIDELPGLRSQMAAAIRSADSAYDNRRIWLFATGGFYALSLLDSILLFPTPSQGSFASLAPWGADAPRLSIGLGERGDLFLAICLTGSDGGAR